MVDVDYFAPQLTGSACGGRNCAAASAAMAIGAGTGGRVRLTADQVRMETGVSCVPGVATPTGGLYISHVIAVGARNGVLIEYGQTDDHAYDRWPAAVIRSRLQTGWGCVVLGDYDQVPVPYRHGSFQGDHSAWMHDYRDDLPNGMGPNVCWHDPLARGPIRLPWNVVLAYNGKPGSPVRGLAGFVLERARPLVWTLHIAEGARVRRYSLDAGGRITGYRDGESWPRGSRATASGPVHRSTAPGWVGDLAAPGHPAPSAATTSLVRDGAYQGDTVRIGAGVTLTSS